MGCLGGSLDAAAAADGTVLERVVGFYYVCVGV